MRLALNADGARIAATPGAPGRCPACASPLRAKCGSIVAWHWAHVTGGDCDPWAEPDSRWHVEWQDWVPADRREVVMAPHRADIVSPDGHVVELQHSNISEADIAAREAHYGRMAWIFNAIDAYQSGRLSVRLRDGYVTFRWKHPRKSIAACRQTVFLDGGWGKLLRAEDVISWLNPVAQPRLVTCPIIENEGPHGSRELVVTCTRCTKITTGRHQPGYSDRSLVVRRALAALRDDCPLGERNFYEVAL